MPIPKERVWLRAAISALYPLVVLGLVLWLVGEVSGLGRQAAIVAGGALAVAVAWLLERHTAGEQTAPQGDVRPAADFRWSILRTVVFGGWCIYGFNVYEVGDRLWWLIVIFVPVAVWGLGYDLYDLCRHRHERAQQRDEKWAPWG